MTLVRLRPNLSLVLEDGDSISGEVAMAAIPSPPPEGLDAVWSVQIMLAKKLIHALDQAREELARRGIGEKQQAGLEKGSIILRLYL